MMADPFGPQQRFAVLYLETWSEKLADSGEATLQHFQAITRTLRLLTLTGHIQYLSIKSTKPENTS